MFWSEFQKFMIGDLNRNIVGMEKFRPRHRIQRPKIHTIIPLYDHDIIFVGLCNFSTKIIAYTSLNKLKTTNEFGECLYYLNVSLRLMEQSLFHFIVNVELFCHVKW